MPLGEASAGPDTLMVFLVGMSVLLAIAFRHVCERLRIPALIGYLLIGLGFGLFDQTFGLLHEAAYSAFDLLAALGLVALLFRVGLGSDPKGLLKKLPSASLIWAISVILSGLSGYLAASLAGFSLVPALVAGVALTATSIGVSIPPWEKHGLLKSESGALTLDVAELDDISGVILMALLLSLLPLLLQGDSITWQAIALTGLSLLVSLAAFIAGCWLFAHWAEPSIARFLARREKPPARMLIVVAIGSLIAALAGFMGFSLAVGALLAGLVFSKAPKTIKEDRTYIVLYDFLVPFFFIGIGLKLDFAALSGALIVGLLLLIAAVIGKVVGAALPAIWIAPSAPALPLAMSMVPRAEIAMVIVDQAGRYGEAVVPPELYGAMTLVTLITCAATPAIVDRLLERQRQPEAN